MHCILHNNNVPFIDKDFIMDIFKVISVRSDNRGNSTMDSKAERMKKLTNFYKTQYSKQSMQMKKFHMIS
jgi:phosphoribulokinase